MRDVMRIKDAMRKIYGMVRQANVPGYQHRSSDEDIDRDTAVRSGEFGMNFDYYPAPNVAASLFVDVYDPEEKPSVKVRVSWPSHCGEVPAGLAKADLYGRLLALAALIECWLEGVDLTGN